MGACDNEALELGKPGPGTEAKLGETGLPDVDVNALLDRVGETRNAMVQRGGRDAEVSVLDNDRTARRRGERLADEAGAKTKGRSLGCALLADLGHLESQLVRVALKQVPGVGAQLVVDPLGHPGRTEQAHRSVAAGQDAGRGRIRTNGPYGCAR